MATPLGTASAATVAPPAGAGALPPAPDGGNVRVALRIRPLIAREVLEHDGVCVWQPDLATPQVVMGEDAGTGGKTFTFDHVFAQGCNQEQVYSTCVRPLVDSFLSGFNSTILAYGQTGSGKTFTVGLANVTHGGEAEQGLIPRVARSLYDEIARRKRDQPGAVFKVRVMFLEIYGDDLRDLLNIAGSRTLSIRETESGISVAGAQERVCETVSEMMATLEEGSLCRSTGSTMMNAHSSRSHAVFTIILDQHVPVVATAGEEGGGGGGETMEHCVSKFHILDLAGSERAKRTKATGRRLQEGININLGLLALGNVISALGDEEKRRKGVHVPYRDSKLTRILQDSLGGNSKTLMVACVSPAEANFEESLNTLRYAARARNIKNKPVINRDAHASQIAQLKAEIEALKVQLLSQAHAGGGDGGAAIALPPPPTTPGMAVSMTALLGAIGTTDMNDVVERLTVMRQAMEEVEALRCRANGAEDDLVRMSSELTRTKERLQVALDDAGTQLARIAVLEEALMHAGVSEAEVASMYATATRGPVPVAAPGSDASASLPGGSGSGAGIARLVHRITELESQLHEAQLRAVEVRATPGRRGRDDGDGGDDAYERGCVDGSGRHGDMATPVHSPLAATAAELLHGVDHKLLVGFDDEDEDDASSGEGGEEEMEEDVGLLIAQPGSHTPQRGGSSGGDGTTSAAFRRIVSRLNFSRLDSRTAAVIREAVPEVAMLSTTASPMGGGGGSGGGGGGDDAMAPGASASLPPSPSGSTSPISHVQQAQAEFARRQSRMGNHVVALEESIAAKLKLVEVLVAKNTEMERLKAFYDVKLREMNEQIAAAARERDRLQHELTKIEHLAVEEREKVKADLLSQLATTNEKLKRLQAKSASAETFVRIKERTDAEIRKLQSDIIDLKRARAAQVGLMRAEKARFAEQLAARNRDIARLHKEDAQLRSELARLKVEGGKRELALRRKLEEASHRGSGGGRSGPAVVRGAGITGVPSVAAGGGIGTKLGRDDRRLSSRNAAVAAVARSVREVKHRTAVAAGKVMMPSDEEIEAELAASAGVDVFPTAAGRGSTGAPSRGSGGTAPASASPASMRKPIAGPPTPAATLKRQLEQAVARIAEREQRVAELERRLKAREQDVKMLESLIEQRDAIKSSLMELVPVSRPPGGGADGGGPSPPNALRSPPAALGELYLSATDKAAGFDPTLIDDINAFFEVERAGEEALAPPPAAATVPPHTPATHPPAIITPIPIVAGEAGPHPAASASKLDLRRWLITPRPPDGEGAMVADSAHGGVTTVGGMEWRERPVSEEESETLRELEERIEAFSARLEYQDAKILHLASADEELSHELMAAASDGADGSGAAGATDDAGANGAGSLQPALVSESTSHRPAMLLRGASAPSMVSSPSAPLDNGAPSSSTAVSVLPPVSTLPQARLALKVLFGMVVDAKHAERTRQASYNAMKVRMDELQASLDAAEDAVKALRLEHERRLMEARREQAVEMDAVIRLAASTAGMEWPSRPPTPSSPSNTGGGPGTGGGSLLSLATPSELLRMLQSTRERFEDMSSTIGEQATTIRELQRERDRLRDEINRLSTLALRVQEMQQRKLGAVAKRPHVGVTEPGEEAAGHGGGSGDAATVTIPKPVVVMPPAPGPSRARPPPAAASSGGGKGSGLNPAPAPTALAGASSGGSGGSSTPTMSRMGGRASGGFDDSFLSPTSLISPQPSGLMVHGTRIGAMWMMDDRRGGPAPTTPSPAPPVATAGEVEGGDGDEDDRKSEVVEVQRADVKQLAAAWKREQHSLSPRGAATESAAPAASSPPVVVAPWSAGKVRPTGGRSVSNSAVKAAAMAGRRGEAPPPPPPLPMPASMAPLPTTNTTWRLTAAGGVVEVVSTASSLPGGVVGGGGKGVAPSTLTGSGGKGVSGHHTSHHHHHHHHPHHGDHTRHGSGGGGKGGGSGGGGEGGGALGARANAITLVTDLTGGGGLTTPPHGYKMASLDGAAAGGGGTPATPTAGSMGRMDFPTLTTVNKSPTAAPATRVMAPPMAHSVAIVRASALPRGVAGGSGTAAPPTPPGGGGMGGVVESRGHNPYPIRQPIVPRQQAGGGGPVVVGSGSIYHVRTSMAEIVSPSAVVGGGDGGTMVEGGSGGGPFVLAPPPAPRAAPMHTPEGDAVVLEGIDDTVIFVSKEERDRLLSMGSATSGGGGGGSGDGAASVPSA